VLVGLGALAIGLAVTFVGAALLSSKRAGPGQLRVVLGFSFVFAVLSWPLLALVAGAIWGHWK
jgi:hypothetical protein